jgi:hypothetical protein
LLISRFLFLDFCLFSVFVSSICHFNDFDLKTQSQSVRVIFPFKRFCGFWIFLNVFVLMCAQTEVVIVHCGNIRLAQPSAVWRQISQNQKENHAAIVSVNKTVYLSSIIKNLFCRNFVSWMRQSQCQLDRLSYTV